MYEIEWGKFVTIKENLNDRVNVKESKITSH